MKIPKEIRTHCPFCNKHTMHKILRIKHRSAPEVGRTLAFGNIKHETKIKGYKGRTSGKKKHIKKRPRNIALLECQECKKKHQRVIGGRTTKKLEFKKD